MKGQAKPASSGDRLALAIFPLRRPSEMDTAATKSNTFGKPMSVNVTYGGSRTEEINSFFQSLLPILAELWLLFEVLSRSHI